MSSKSFFGVLVILFIAVIKVQTLKNECGILYCSQCNSATNFCYECELPYKPVYANQSVCGRCSNNCGVCEKQADNSKGRCLSCLPHFDYSRDDHCDTFEIWIYVVVIACYVIFIIILFIVFCYIKRKKERKQSLWYDNLKSHFNKVDTDKITILEFQKMCEYLVELLKQSSSYNNLKFKDRQYEKAMKIKNIKFKLIKAETHMKKIKIEGFDNSQWEGQGYVFIPKDENSKLKLWFVKNYKRRVYSENISKIIIYESDTIESHIIKGKWYYHGSPEIGGQWKGIRQQPHDQLAHEGYIRN